jgi:hypothetical protein
VGHALAYWIDMKYFLSWSVRRLHFFSNGYRKGVAL